MYEAFYGLNEKPFNLTPDPRFLYLSSKHKEAFAHLLYGIRNRCGFVMVSGEIGTGKTTICRSLLKQLDPDTEVAFIFNPKLSPIELLQTINGDFGIDSKAETVRGLIDELNAHLLDRASKGKNCVLIIDEAQNLGTETLEQIRLLSNLETETEKLLQIVLIGQPELAAKLELTELRQLNQRITARYHLGMLSSDETLHYIAFRLRVAGGRKKLKFTRSAVRTVHRISRGTPRVINALCDRALLIGYTKETRNISPSIVRKAAAEIQGAGRPGTSYGRFRKLVPATFVAAAALVAVMAALWWPMSNYEFPFRPATGGGDPESSATALPVSAKQPDEVPSAEAVKLAEAPPGPAHEDSIATTQLPPRGIAEAAIVSPAPENSIVKTETLPPPAAAPTQKPITTAVTDTPKPEVPKAEVPKAEAPKVEVPTVQAPKAEVPKAETPPATQVASLASPVIDAAEKEKENLSAPKGPQPHQGLSAIVRAWDLAVLESPPRDVTWSSIVQFAMANGLRALSMSPNTTQIAAIDLPVLVRLREGGALEWAAVTSFERNMIKVLYGDGREEELKPDDFRKAYTGDAFYLWNDPSPKAEPIRARTEGEAVSSLQADLKALGLLAGDPTGTYDVPTIDAVGRIQRATGIAVDGVAGPQTRMVLTSWLDRGGAPSLSAAGFTDNLRARVLAQSGMIQAENPGGLESVPLPESIPVSGDKPAVAEGEAPGR